MGIFGFNPTKKPTTGKKTAKAADKKAVQQKLKAKKAAGGCEFC